MQNFRKCSGRQPPIPTSVHSRSGAASALAFLAEAHAGPRRLASPDTASSPAPAPRISQTAQYSIRFTVGAGTCAFCAAKTGTGPVGYRDAEPICDRCMLEQCEPLGMVLALVAVTRAYADTDTSDPDEARESLVDLGAFARIHEVVVAKWGPARLIADDVRG